MKILKRFLIIVSFLIVTIILLAFAFISPITKYLIQKYDVEYINREITIDKLWLNIFNGNVTIQGITVFEEKSKDKFFSCQKIESSISIPQLLKSEYNISQFTLTSPFVQILQDNSSFNFDDILKKFESDPKAKKPVKEEIVKYWLNNISVLNGHIVFTRKQLKQTIELVKFNFTCPSISNKNSNVNCNTKFDFKTGGHIETQLNFDQKTLAYQLQTDVKDFNLVGWFAYLEDYMNIKSLNGFLNTSLAITGNFNTPAEIIAKGKFSLNDFDLIDPVDTHLVKMKSLSVDINEIDVKKGIYNLQNLTFNEPYLLFELYDNGNNFERLLKDTTTSISDSAAIEYGNMFAMMAAYIEDISRNYAVTNYKSDKIAIQNGHIIYQDFTLDQVFRFDMTEFNMNASNVKSSQDSIKFDINSVMNESGKLTAALSVNPNDFKDLSLSYNISGLRLSDFNPYSVFYVAYPFMDGIIDYSNTTKIEKHFIKSLNHLKILKVEIGKSAKEKPLYSLPMKLAIAILRDPKGNIDLKIPVEGDLDDPKYKIGKVIWQIIKNILIKAATAPFKLLGNLFNANEIEMKEIPFQYLQSEITKDQFKRLDMIKKVLEQKPELKAELIQVNNTELEMENYAIYEAKKQFYFLNRNLAVPDSLSKEENEAINQIEIHDSLFVNFINSKSIGADPLTPLQSKCINLIGKEVLTKIISENMVQRNILVLNYLHNVHQVPLNRIRVINTKDQAAANKMTVSKYLINYYVDEGTTTTSETNK